MSPDFDSRLRALAEVVVRVGVNLQPGQPLLVTDPYDLLGVHPDALPWANAIKEVAGPGTRILTADPAGLRDLAERNDERTYGKHVVAHTLRLLVHLKLGGAFLFLTGGAPGLFAGLPAERLARFDAIKWRELGPFIQRLIRGATQWSLLPAPTSEWAAAAGRPVSALSETVFSALRVGTGAHVQSWQNQLSALAARRDELNAARPRQIRYVGPGTDLTLDLPSSHAWCTAQLISKAGIPFVANLPTEEIFTAPHKNSTNGTVRVSRPVAHGGTVIDGIQLQFRRGKVVDASAQSGEGALRHLLATDGGAGRIGEVAIIPGAAAWQSSSRLFHHTLLDENAAPHIALGDAYPFCSRAFLPLALNRSQVHLDLPLDARVELD